MQKIVVLCRIILQSYHNLLLSAKKIANYSFFLAIVSRSHKGNGGNFCFFLA